MLRKADHDQYIRNRPPLRVECDGASDDLLQVETGSLYLGLHRLEAKGLIKASWDLSEKGKRAKYYRLTNLGRKHLSAERTKWETFARAMGLVLKPVGQEQ